jgi:hypothetical protein
MNDREIKELQDKLKKYHTKINKDKTKVHDFLIRAGILTQKGELASQYKNLCTPHEQD